MKKIAHLVGTVVSALFVSSILLAACSGPTNTGTAASSTPTAASVQAYANSITENVLVSLSNDDYTSFSKDFDQTAKSAISESTFAQTYNQISATIGTYQSFRYFNFSTQNANATTVIYVAQYSDEPAGVTVTMVFQDSGGNEYIHGFTLDSPKLRGQSIDVEEVRSYADLETENVLVSLGKDQYETFSQDFDSTMKSSINASSFRQLYNNIKTTVGDYVSKEFESVSLTNGIYTIRYLAQYTDEPAGVWVTISFDNNHKVAGLYFNSPKLNAQ